jgi:NAD(P)H-dependent flavin oxidoreductase YrpB (nitropropane dioxygenase family)
MEKQVLRTPLCERLGIEYPICLAGMGGRGNATPPRLVAAVSNAGGLGVIGGSGMSPEEISTRIREVRALTDKPFGVDLLLPARLADSEDTRAGIREQLRREYPKHVAFVRSLMREFDLPDDHTEKRTATTRKNIQGQVEVVLEEKVPVFAAALGDPSWVVPLAREKGITVFGMAGSVRHAQRQVEAGVDIVVAQGYEAGGHTGRVANFPLIPQVVDAVTPIPVIAAGGIGDGRGVAAALALGAVGAWVGTAFLVAEECLIPERHKEDILRGATEDFVITRSYTGKTARDYKNVVIDAWENSDLDPLPMPLQGALMADFVEAADKGGRPDLIASPAGQIGGMLKDPKPAATIMDELVQGAVEVLQKLQSSVVSA